MMGGSVECPTEVSDALQTLGLPNNFFIEEHNAYIDYMRAALQNALIASYDEHEWEHAFFPHLNKSYALLGKVLPRKIEEKRIVGNGRAYKSKPWNITR